MSFLFIGFISALFGVVWVHKLTDTGELFEWFPILIQRLTSNKKIHQLTFNCSGCVAGQAAFWSMLIIGFLTLPYSILVILLYILEMIAAIVIAIYFSQILETIYLYAKEQAQNY